MIKLPNSFLKVRVRSKINKSIRSTSLKRGIKQHGFWACRSATMAIIELGSWKVTLDVWGFTWRYEHRRIQQYIQMGCVTKYIYLSIVRKYTWVISTLLEHFQFPILLLLLHYISDPNIALLLHDIRLKTLVTNLA